MSNKYKFRGLVLLLPLLSSCATMPSGPSVMALPGTGKNFNQFRADDQYCRQYSLSQIGGTSPQQAYVSSGIGSALVGAGVGAALGAAVGGGPGAAIGAGAGLAGGSIAGTGASRVSGYQAQQYYDMNYVQCMYSLGDRVPVSGQISDDSSAAGQQFSNSPPPPPPNSNLPPPPPPPAGQPPAPPPR